jgi:hypothetical protein
MSGLRTSRPQVLELVSSDSLNVPSEEDVYRAVLSWVKHDVDTRRQHVPRVRPGPGAPVLSEGNAGGCGISLLLQVLSIFHPGTPLEWLSHLSQDPISQVL